MNIDAVLGVVNFPGITIGSQLSRPEFLQSTLGATAELGVVNQGWVTLHIEPEPELVGSLIFKDDKLIQLFVSMKLPPGDEKQWDRATEMLRKAHHDTWLKAELGNPPYEYLWGTVGSEFDEKGFSSDIIVTFGKFPVEEDWRERKRREREEAARKST